MPRCGNSATPCARCRVKQKLHGAVPSWLIRCVLVPSEVVRCAFRVSYTAPATTSKTTAQDGEVHGAHGAVLQPRSPQRLTSPRCQMKSDGAYSTATGNSSGDSSGNSTGNSSGNGPSASGVAPSASGPAAALSATATAASASDAA